jgi:rubrerythrin
MMAITFTADEIFEMALQIERDGEKFYRTAAKHTTDIAFKELLLELAKMEAEHEKTFAAMQTELSPAEQPDIFDPDNELVLYLHSIVNGKVFDMKTDPAEQLTGKETAQDILEKAIDMEKNSIVFYLGIEEYVPQRAGKDKVRAIIKQEIGHIALLVDKRDALV